jgi:hypothetical protein
LYYYCLNQYCYDELEQFVTTLLINIMYLCVAVGE